MDGSAWQVLRDLQAWQITQIPRRPSARQDSAAGQDQAGRGGSQRLSARYTELRQAATPGLQQVRFAIEHAVGTRSGDQDWKQRLIDVLDVLHDCRRLLGCLSPASTGT